jgi:FAD/FMN-containing dehydrogenase
LNVLPQLSPKDTISIETQNYLRLLQDADYLGDIEISYSSRLAVATDNSIYQQIPQAVLFPKNISDMQEIARLSNSNDAITFSARGGGT